MESIITISDEEYLRIIAIIRTTRDMDLSNYQPSILKHRITRFAQLHGFMNITTIIDKMKMDKVFVDIFLKEVKAPTTEMFRDPQTWMEIDKILGERLKQESMVKIWIPDICGDDELYSMIAMLHRNGMLQKSLVYATSHYQSCIDGCQEGYIDKKKYEISNDNFMKMETGGSIADFIKPFDKGYKFSNQLLQKAIFIKQSVQNDNPPDQGFNLILFRNRLLYFNPGAKKRLVEQLTKSLLPGGYLILGIGENINGLDVANQYTQVSKTEKIYRKK